MLWGSRTNPWRMEFGLRPAQQHTSPIHSNNDKMQGGNSFRQSYINPVRLCLLILSFPLQRFLLVFRTPLDWEQSDVFPYTGWALPAQIILLPPSINPYGIMSCQRIILSVSARMDGQQMNWGLNGFIKYLSHIQLYRLREIIDYWFWMGMEVMLQQNLIDSAWRRRLFHYACLLIPLIFFSHWMCLALHL